MSFWKAHLQDQPWRMQRCLHVIRRDPNGSVAIAGPLIMHGASVGELLPETDGILAGYSQETDDFLRAIMDAAWEAGIRPTGFEDHTNELKATRYHLEDMRLLSKVIK